MIGDDVEYEADPAALCRLAQLVETSGAAQFTTDAIGCHDVVAVFTAGFGLGNRREVEVADAQRS